MLGQLLEFSITASPIAPTLDFYRRLGFEELATGDILQSPYAAIWDGNMVAGLHDWGFDSPALCFARPDLDGHLRGLKRLGIHCEFTQLADTEFNQAGFRDPNGQLILLLEARTFSPGIWESSNVAACGQFLEYSLATHSVEESCAYWARLGLMPITTGNAPYPWARLGGCGLTLGLHQTGGFKAALCFEAVDLAARLAYLEAKGLSPTRRAPQAIDGRGSAALQAPDGTLICLLEAAV